MAKKKIKEQKRQQRRVERKPEAIVGKDIQGDLISALAINEMMEVTTKIHPSQNKYGKCLTGVSLIFASL